MNKTNRGTAELRDLGPAEGTYEADYVIYTNIRSIKHLGSKPTEHKTFTADIRLTSGRSLKNGIYMLEKEGNTICRLRKTGPLWELDDEPQQTKETENEKHRRK